jgi:hypothetical protein
MVITFGSVLAFADPPAVPLDAQPATAVRKASVVTSP